MQNHRIITTIAAFVGAAIAISIYFFFADQNPEKIDEVASASQPSVSPEIPEEADANLIIEELAENNVSEEISKPADDSETTPDSSKIDTIFISPEEIADLIAQKGPIEAYREGDEAIRFGIIEHLADHLEMEAYFVDLLKIEQDSDLRAYLFINFKPDNFFEFTDPGINEPNETLRQALDTPMDTNIEPLEYANRIKTSMADNAELAIDQARLARDSWPEDDYLQYIAAQTMLRANQMTDTLDQDEIDAAYADVREALNVPPWESEMSPSERIEGFYAMHDWGTSSELRQFYEEQIAIETDSRALDILVRLLETVPVE